MNIDTLTDAAGGQGRRGQGRRGQGTTLTRIRHINTYVCSSLDTHTHTQKQLKAKVEEAAKAKAEAEEAAAEATKKAAADANAQKEADAKEAKEKEAKEKEAKDKEAAEKEQVRDGDDAKAEKEAHTRITYACMFESYTHTQKQLEAKLAVKAAVEAKDFNKIWGDIVREVLLHVTSLWAHIRMYVRILHTHTHTHRNG